jgi:hypothetical protein
VLLYSQQLQDRLRENRHEIPEETLLYLRESILSCFQLHMTNTNINYFRIIETTDTVTGQIHSIEWNYYLPKKFYKGLGKHVRELGWMKNGQYSISRNNKNTNLTISEDILHDFKQIVAFLLRDYSL